jgi:hypothetical protein
MYEFGIKKKSYELVLSKQASSKECAGCCADDPICREA